MKYNAFEHLWRSVFSIFARERLMTMLAAYFDESGTDGQSPIVAVAGYISTVDRWANFQIEWQDFLDKNKIDTFHTTDLIARRGEFTKDRGWNRNRAESALRIADRIIANNVLCGVAAYVTIADCEKIFPIKGQTGKRRKFSIEYYMAAGMAAALITQWAEDNSYNEPIRLVFEDGVHGKGYLMKGIDRAKERGIGGAHLLGGMSFESKSKVNGISQLHAADRLVHLLCKGINKFLVDENSGNEEREQLGQIKLWKVNRIDGENFHLLVPAAEKILKEFYENNEEQ